MGSGATEIATPKLVSFAKSSRLGRVSKAAQRDEREPDRLVLTAGVRLGKYQLVRRLAVGGMAEIFLARASGIEGFEKLVVLKSILAQHAGDEQFVRMFLDEARLAATL